MGYGTTMFLVMTAVLLFDGAADGRLNAFDHWHDHLAGWWFYLGQSVWSSTEHSCQKYVDCRLF